MEPLLEVESIALLCGRHKHMRHTLKSNHQKQARLSQHIIGSSRGRSCCCALVWMTGQTHTQIIESGRETGCCCALVWQARVGHQGVAALADHHRLEWGGWGKHSLLCLSLQHHHHADQHLHLHQCLQQRQ